MKPKKKKRRREKHEKRLGAFIHPYFFKKIKIIDK
jgi:hypothetical protein